MPFLEVIMSRPEPLTEREKRAFAEEAVKIFQSVLGTPPGRLRLAFYQLRPEDTVDLLEPTSPQAQES